EAGGPLQRSALAGGERGARAARLPHAARRLSLGSGEPGIGDDLDVARDPAASGAHACRPACGHGAVVPAPLRPRADAGGGRRDPQHRGERRLGRLRRPGGAMTDGAMTDVAIATPRRPARRWAPLIAAASLPALLLGVLLASLASGRFAV